MKRYEDFIQAVTDILKDHSIMDKDKLESIPVQVANVMQEAFVDYVNQQSVPVDGD